MIPRSELVLPSVVDYEVDHVPTFRLCPPAHAYDLIEVVFRTDRDVLPGVVLPRVVDKQGDRMTESNNLIRRTQRHKTGGTWMNKKRTLILAIAVLYALLASSTFTVAINGLQWGVEVGDRTEYELRIRVVPEGMPPENREWTYILDVYMEIMELGNLSVDYSNSGIWFYTHFVLDSDLFLDNGTNLAGFLPSGLGGGAGAISTWLYNTGAIPIGNWTFTSMLVEGSVYTTIDDDQFWGYTVEGDASYEEWRWFKTNGTLSYVRFDNATFETMPASQVIDILLQERTVDAELPVILLVGAAGAVVTVLAVVVVLRRR